MPDGWPRLQRSTNTGATFTAIDPFAAEKTTPQNPTTHYGGVRMSRAASAIVYWFGEADIYEGAGTPHWEYFYLMRSTDWGANWSEKTVPNAADSDRVTTLRCTLGKTWRVVLHEYNNDDLYRSTNGCNAGGWTALDEAMDFDPSDLVMDEDNPVNVFTIGNSAAAATLVERTTNEGDDWRDLTGNLDDDTSDYVTSVVIPRRV